MSTFKIYKTKKVKMKGDEVEATVGTVRAQCMWAKVRRGQAESYQEGAKKYVKDPLGTYTIDLAITPETLDEIEKEAERLRLEFKNKYCKGKKVIDCEIEEKEFYTKEGSDPDPITEGKVKLTPKAKAGGTRKDGTEWFKDIPVFTPDGKTLHKKELGNGSDVEVQITLVPYNMGKELGCSVKLGAIVVHDLVEYGGQEENVFGFTVEASDEPEEDDNDLPFEPDEEEDDIPH